MITKTFPLKRVEEVLRATVRKSVRERVWPSHVMVYSVVDLALYMESSAREVLRCRREGLRWLVEPEAKMHVAGDAGIPRARRWLAYEPLKRSHDELVGPVAEAATRGDGTPAVMDSKH